MEGVAFVICVSGHSPELHVFQGRNWVSVTSVSWHLAWSRVHTHSISSRAGMGSVSAALRTELSCTLNNVMPEMPQGLPTVNGSLRAAERGQLQGDKLRGSRGCVVGRASDGLPCSHLHPYELFLPAIWRGQRVSSVPHE